MIYHFVDRRAGPEARRPGAPNWGAGKPCCFDPISAGFSPFSSMSMVLEARYTQHPPSLSRQRGWVEMLCLQSRAVSCDRNLGRELLTRVANI